MSSVVPAAEMVRGELDYAAQVPRLLSYKHEHPDAEIIYLGSWWQYLRVEGNGLTVIVRYTLEELLDRLESLDGGAGGHSPTPPGDVPASAV